MSLRLPPGKPAFAASPKNLNVLRRFQKQEFPARHYFASERITEIAVANPHINDLRAHRNEQEVHRELRQTPQRAWDQARKEKRSVLRPAPRCPWWDYVWSVRTVIQVGSDGRVPIGTQRLRIEKPPESKVVLCLHPTGHHSVLAAAPDPHPKTRAPLHQSSQINIPALLTTKHSCFENYATIIPFYVALNLDQV